MYSKIQFAYDLKKRLALKMTKTDLSKWACSIYKNCNHMNDELFLNILLLIANMKISPKLELSYKELNIIADNLIDDANLSLENGLFNTEFEDVDIRLLFGCALKQKVKSKVPINKIAIWTYHVYWENLEIIERNHSFEDLLNSLSNMDIGTGFELPFEKLEQIADALITEKDIIIEEL